MSHLHNNISCTKYYFIRGEDTATLPVHVQIPVLHVQMECEVDGMECGDVIKVNSKSLVSYKVSVFHTLVVLFQFV